MKYINSGDGVIEREVIVILLQMISTVFESGLQIFFRTAKHAGARQSVFIS